MSAQQDLHTTFSVPRATLGEFIMGNARARCEAQIPYAEGEFWLQVYDWIIGQTHEPDRERDLFGAPRSKRIREYLAEAEGIRPAAAASAYAMSLSNLIFLWEGPDHFRDLGIPPLHRIFDALLRNGGRVTPSSLICMTSDFAACGEAYSTLIEQFA